METFTFGSRLLLKVLGPVSTMQGGRFLYTNQQVSDTNWTSYNSTQC